METALEILARLGTDNPPTHAELLSARNEIARELRAQKGKSNDLEALMSLRAAYDLAEQAVAAAEAAEAEAAAEVDDVLDGVVDPDAALEVEADEVPQVLPMDEALSRLGLRTQTVEVVNEPDPVDTLSMVRTEVTIGNEKRDSASWDDLAQAFSESTRSQRPGKERIARITSEFADERSVTVGDTAGNTRLIDSFVSPEAVTAAGGCCSLPTPIYENPVAGSLARPIRDSLPTIGVRGRGAVTFFPAICIADGGSDVWTCEDDAAVTDDPETWKDCLDAECDEPETVNVEGIYACNTVGNFMDRFANEQWRGHLRAVSIRQARLADANLFGKMRAATTSTHTGISTGSTYANFLNTVGRAGALIRQDQRLEEVRLTVWAPSWLPVAIREDFRVRGLNTGRDEIELIMARLEAALANENIRAVWSQDIDDIETVQYDGALADYPDTASTVLAADGFFSFLDGGTLDLGTEIRDHDLNRQNKLAAFAESFEGLLARGCNAKSLDIPVETCAVADCPA